MLFKISCKNIRKSMRDYAIYFFTLVIGVSIFYVFNAIGTQMGFMKLADDTRQISELLVTLISMLSIFVAIVLGLLIVYASRFLMKRRNHEFAIYMTLGMSKGRISMILVLETMLIGIGSLACGLLLGIGLSQLMSALVANLFEADMTDYAFTVSCDAIVKTLLCFVIIYLVAMIFNSLIITRMRLIQLIQSGQKSERVHLHNPVLCVLIFVIAAAVLGRCYYQVGWDYANLTTRKLLICIICGAICTFLVFWSISGLLLRLVMMRKKTYYRGLNAFTFRQISSKVNTMVLSMSVICLMLFITICTLAAGFSVRNSLNHDLKTQCPVDMEVAAVNGSKPVDLTKDWVMRGHECGFPIDDYMSDYVQYCLYYFKDYKASDFLGPEAGDRWDTMIETFIGVSDYNRLAQLYGKDSIELSADEFVLLCDFKNMTDMRNDRLANNREITVGGTTLKSKYDHCVDGFVQISAQHINMGVFVVPDETLQNATVNLMVLSGNYRANTDAQKKSIDKKAMKAFNHDYLINTKIDIANASIGLGAIITFIGLYIGIVFLIASGAILALKELSESVDSIHRYEMLRKIGVDERDLTRSLFRQTGIFFLLPFAVAAIHSVFGMKFAVNTLEIFGTGGLPESIAASAMILALIYGGYFVVTYLCAKAIVRDNSRL